MLPKIYNHLKERATELSSIMAASGAAGCITAYLTGAMTLQQAEAGIVACVIAYVCPQAKPFINTPKV